MLEYIDAPIPYVIGVPKDIWKKIKKERGRDLSWIAADVSIFDIDKGKFKRKEKTQEFPENITKILRNNLIDIVKQSKCLLETQLYDFWMESTLRIRTSFLIFILNLIGYFPSFINQDANNKDNSLGFFQSENYLNSLPETHLAFMREFLKTQHFTSFLEKINRSKQEQNDILGFLETVEHYHTLGEVAFITHLEHFTYRLMNKFKHVITHQIKKFSHK